MPLAAAALWGLFAAPRAVVRARVPRFAVKTALFGSAAAGIWAMGHLSIAIVFASSPSSLLSRPRRTGAVVMR